MRGAAGFRTINAVVQGSYAVFGRYRVSEADER